MWYTWMIFYFGHVHNLRLKYFKEDGNSYNWEHSKGELVSEFLGIDIKTLDNGGFQFFRLD